MTQAIKERGRVRRMRMALMPVRISAHGPGPVGSAGCRISITY